MGLAICLIMWFHSIYDVQNAALALVKNMCDIGVDMFMFLSGFSMASEKKGLSASGSGREVTTRDHGASSGWTFSEGTGEYRGFVLDNVLRSSTQGNIHFNLYVPDSYDGTKPYALFVTLPGYQGLHFQGVGINLRTEEFGFVAQD